MPAERLFQQMEQREYPCQRDADLPEYHERLFYRSRPLDNADAGKRSDRRGGKAEEGDE